jgi:5-methylthioadenosine/S-adenosylhomocysteine deaminase
LTEDDLLVSARLGAVEALRAGITTLGDTADSAVVADVLGESGQRGVVFQEVFGVAPAAAEQSLAGLQAKVAALRARAGALVRVGVSPHAPYTVSPRLFSLVAEYARAEALPVAIHTAESRAEDQFVRLGAGPFAESYRARGVAWQPAGTSVVRYLSDLGVLAAAPLLIHSVQLDADDIELIAASKSKVAHCPKSNAKFGHGIAPLRLLLAGGVAVGLGTDSVASNNACDLIEEARAACLLARAAAGEAQAPTAAAMIELATLGGARALGLDQLIGSLEPGKQADLCAVDLAGAALIPAADPATALVFSANARDVRCTVVAGRVLYDAGAVKTIDEAETVRAALRAAARIFAG